MVDVKDADHTFATKTLTLYANNDSDPLMILSGGICIEHHSPTLCFEYLSIASLFLYIIFAMEGKVFLCQYLIWMMLLLGQIHGYKSCIENERRALLELKTYMISISEEGQSNYVLPSWTNDAKSDCCHWEEIKCNRTSGRVIKIAFGGLYLKESPLLNLSLLHPFEEVQSLNL